MSSLFDAASDYMGPSYTNRSYNSYSRSSSRSYSRSRSGSDAETSDLLLRLVQIMRVLQDMNKTYSSSLSKSDIEATKLQWRAASDVMKAGVQLDIAEMKNATDLVSIAQRADKSYRDSYTDLIEKAYIADSNILRDAHQEYRTVGGERPGDAAATAAMAKLSGSWAEAGQFKDNAAFAATFERAAKDFLNVDMMTISEKDFIARVNQFPAQARASIIADFQKARTQRAMQDSALRQVEGNLSATQGVLADLQKKAASGVGLEDSSIAAGVQKINELRADRPKLAAGLLGENDLTLFSNRLKNEIEAHSAENKDWQAMRRTADMINTMLLAQVGAAGQQGIDPARRALLEFVSNPAARRWAKSNGYDRLGTVNAEDVRSPHKLPDGTTVMRITDTIYTGYVPNDDDAKAFASFQRQTKRHNAGSFVPPAEGNKFNPDYVKVVSSLDTMDEETRAKVLANASVLGNSGRPMYAVRKDADGDMTLLDKDTLAKRMKAGATFSSLTGTPRYSVGQQADAGSFVVRDNITGEISRYAVTPESGGVYLDDGGAVPVVDEGQWVPLTEETSLGQTTYADRFDPYAAKNAAKDWAAASVAAGKAEKFSAAQQKRFDLEGVTLSADPPAK